MARSGRLVGLLVATIAVASAGCGNDFDKNDPALQEKRAKAEKRAAALEKATKPGAKTKSGPPPSKAELMDKCKSDDGAACQGACVLGDGDSCSRLGALFEEGRGGVPEDFSSALLFHRKACKLHSGDGCYATALFYKLGKEIPKNPDRAKEFFENACKVGHEAACMELEATAQGKSGKKHKKRK